MEAEAGQAAIQDKGIQCELLRDPSLGPTDHFDILDKKLRRNLVQRVYLLLIVCNTYLCSFASDSLTTFAVGDNIDDTLLGAIACVSSTRN